MDYILSFYKDDYAMKNKANKVFTIILSIFFIFKVYWDFEAKNTAYESTSWISALISSTSVLVLKSCNWYILVDSLNSLSGNFCLYFGALHKG